MVRRMEYTHLITLAETLARHTGRAEATIANKAVGYARFFARLREGKGCAVHTANKAAGWFSENWPADLPWPEDIPRPAKSDATPGARAS